ncbi:hypothetical protein [Photobacterium sanguinicancri]|uniref:hypothetical protein n=1 Tax=Photobacterium sanguinicancri TaxID=875932 RepID=UPI0021C340E8|nr:hypothetical protein [Photobacterium sanguinicancri]
MNKTDELGKLTQEELSKESNRIDSTIETLLLELKLVSPTKSNQARFRLDFWERKRFELDNFLRKKNKKA